MGKVECCDILVPYTKFDRTKGILRIIAGLTGCRNIVITGYIHNIDYIWRLYRYIISYNRAKKGKSEKIDLPLKYPKTQPTYNCYQLIYAAHTCNSVPVHRCWSDLQYFVAEKVCDNF